MGLFCGSILEQVKEKEDKIQRMKLHVRAQEVELDVIKQEIQKFQNVAQVAEAPANVKVLT